MISANVQCPIGKILVVLNVNIIVKMLFFCLKNNVILCTDLELGNTSYRDEGRTDLFLNVCLCIQWGLAKSTLSSQ